jgi:ribosome maturation factor RimP
MITEQEISQMVAEKFSEEGLSHCFLVDIEMKGTKALKVYIDSAEGVSFGECKKLSRFLEEKIEAGSLMDKDYLLEVSSPGVDRPLKFLKQYPKHLGRLFELETEEGIFTAALSEVSGDKLVFEKKEPKGKKKNVAKADKELYEINFESIRSAKVLISF